MLTHVVRRQSGRLATACKRSLTSSNAASIRSSLLTPTASRFLHSSTSLSPRFVASRSRTTLHGRTSSALLSVSPASASSSQPVRLFNIHEYQAVEVFHEYSIPTARCKVAGTPEEAEKVAEELATGDYVVKAQVLAGGRGKGHFDSGFRGGVHTCILPSEVRDLAGKMLNHSLITHQTGPEGKPCNKVLVSERLYLRREAYFAILMDRESQGPVMVASPAGGMDIEKVAAETPHLIHKETVDLNKGPEDVKVERLAKAMGFSGPKQVKEAAGVMKALYKLFREKDSTLVEINPLAETHDGRIVAVDAKLNFDDNAAFRQKPLFAMRDPTQEDKREVEADKAGLNYIGLDGNIGCLVNGAGLAMATLDVIKLHGGNPANFLDMGGGASKDQVMQAFQLLNKDEQVKAILVNIFGGIMRCDVIALGLIAAATQLGLKKPVVIRLQGTNVEEAKRLIDESGLRMLTAGDLGEAAQKVVRVVDILKMAEDAHVKVNFELPL